MKCATKRALFCKYFSVYLHVVLILGFFPFAVLVGVGNGEYKTFVYFQDFGGFAGWDAAGEEAGGDAFFLLDAVERGEEDFGDFIDEVEQTLFAFLGCEVDVTEGGNVFAQHQVVDAGNEEGVEGFDVDAEGLEEGFVFQQFLPAVVFAVFGTVADKVVRGGNFPADDALEDGVFINGFIKFFEDGGEKFFVIGAPVGYF